MSKQLLLMADSNVRRWLPRLGDPYHQVMDYTPVHNLDELPSSIAKINSSYKMVVFAGLTNIIVSAGSASRSRHERLEAISKAIGGVFETLR